MDYRHKSKFKTVVLSKKVDFSPKKYFFLIFECHNLPSIENVSKTWIINWNMTWKYNLPRCFKFYLLWFQEKLPPGLEDFTLYWTLRMPKTTFLLLPLYQNISRLLGPHFISTYKFSHSYFLQVQWNEKQIVKTTICEQ